MVRSGAATITCETQTPSRFWRGFGKSPPLQTATTVRLSVQHLHNDQPTESLAVWAYIVPPKAMKHAVLLRRHRMRFGEGSYNTAPCDHTRAITAFWVISLHRIKIRLAPMPSSRSFRHHQAVITSFARAIEASRSRATTNLSKFPWFAVTAPQLRPVDILWTCSMVPHIFQSTRIVENGHQQIPLVGTAELEPGDLLGTFPCPLLRAPVGPVLYDDGSASASTPGTPDEPDMIVAGPLSPTPACADPVVHHVSPKLPKGGPGAAKPTSAYLEPPPSLLYRLNSNQGDSFLQVWHKLWTHLREISFDFQGPGWDPDVINLLRDILIDMSLVRHLWLVLPPAVRNFGPTWQSPGDLPPQSRESPCGQTNGHDSERISRGRPHTTLHVAIRESCGQHTKEIRWDSAYDQLQEVERHQHSRSAFHTPRQ